MPDSANFTLLAAGCFCTWNCPRYWGTSRNKTKMPAFIELSHKCGKMVSKRRSIIHFGYYCFITLTSLWISILNSHCYSGCIIFDGMFISLLNDALFYWWLIKVLYLIVTIRKLRGEAVNLFWSSLGEQPLLHLEPKVDLLCAVTWNCPGLDHSTRCAPGQQKKWWRSLEWQDKPWYLLP